MVRRDGVPANWSVEPINIEQIMLFLTRGGRKMKAMLYADWMNLRRSMKALLVVGSRYGAGLDRLGKRTIGRLSAMLSYAVAYGARNAYEQRLCLRMG
ncbi:hypothetical protein [Agathobaculum butyriciproducens]|uniref:hypothetical protein n=1 Tax=Agathobaculum butyriciproducens TaxID=1628085 RepID=UPI0036D24296